MSNRRKLPRPNERAVRKAELRLLSCPDCPSAVTMGEDVDGSGYALVTHDKTCPAIPPDAQARGHRAYRVPLPIVVTAPVQRR